MPLPFPNSSGTKGNRRQLLPLWHQNPASPDRPAVESESDANADGYAANRAVCYLVDASAFASAWLFVRYIPRYHIQREPEWRGNHICLGFPVLSHRKTQTYERTLDGAP